MAMMKLYIVAFFTGALTCTLTSANANFKAPAFHHILKSLETKQELPGVGDCSGNYVTQYFFTNVSGELGLDCYSTLAQLPDDANDEDFNEVWCTGACAEALTTLYEECNSLGYEQAYRANCGRGPGGKLCISIETEQKNIGSPVLVNALTNCPDSDSCSEACKASVEAGIETYGCCLNNYLTDPLARCIFRLDNFQYLASDKLLTACGVPTDIGFCYGSAWAKSSSAMFGAALIAALMPLLVI